MSTIKWGSLVFAQYQVSNEICKLGDRILLQNYHAVRWWVHMKTTWTCACIPWLSVLEAIPVS